MDDQGRLIGVTAAIKSASQSNAGIGFVIPSAIVSKEVPTLIKSGSYQHPYLGISGTTLTPDLAQAMNLNPSQRGALVEDVTPGTPAANAGLQGSSNTATINGQQVNVGGDVITAVNGQKVTTMDDLISYLFGQTEVGQTVTLTVLRNGNETSVKVNLEARPNQTPSTSGSGILPGQGNGNNGNNGNGNNGNSGQAAAAYIGVSTVDMNAQIAQAMNLPASQMGVLVEAVQPGSPAEQAGLQAGSQNMTIGGQQVLVGGDIITGIDGTTVNSTSDLTAALRQDQPGQTVQLNILRNGNSQTVSLTLGSRLTQ